MLEIELVLFLLHAIALDTQPAREGICRIWLTHVVLHLIFSSINRKRPSAWHWRWRRHRVFYMLTFGLGLTAAAVQLSQEDESTALIRAPFRR